jgi:hypothetical protein
LLDTFVELNVAITVGVQISKAIFQAQACELVLDEISVQSLEFFTINRSAVVLVKVLEVIGSNLIIMISNLFKSVIYLPSSPSRGSYIAKSDDGRYITDLKF